MSRSYRNRKRNEERDIQKNTVPMSEAVYKSRCKYLSKYYKMKYKDENFMSYDELISQGNDARSENKAKIENLNKW